MKASRILITSGEPAGIGPEIIAQAAQQAWPAELIVLGDPELLASRAKQLQLPLNLLPFDANSPAEVLAPGNIKIIPLPLNQACQPGKLNPANAAYVLRMLEKAHELAMAKTVDAVVTAPVHKEILNEAGIAFQGHTEFFAERAGVKKAVMLFVVAGKDRGLKVALITTHLALAKVPQAITASEIDQVLRILHQALKERFGLADPAIYVCGLNPHAGEGGYLGREEIEVITPALDKLRAEGKKIVGPLSADTIFTEKYLRQADAIVAMYHDQALPVVKYLGFGQTVNVTLGLPYVRTSVDHGTALDVAGTAGADAGSLIAAIELAIELGI